MSLCPWLVNYAEKERDVSVISHYVRITGKRVSFQRQYVLLHLPREHYILFFVKRLILAEALGYRAVYSTTLV